MSDVLDLSTPITETLELETPLADQEVSLETPVTETLELDTPIYKFVRQTGETILVGRDGVLRDADGRIITFLG